MNGLTDVVVPGISDRMVSPVSMPWVTLAPAAHHAVLSSDTSISTASPVRSRWNSAAEMPPAMFIPPIESPKAGMPCGRAPPISSGRQGVTDAAAGPEGGPVEAADEALGSLVAVGAAAGVDDVRVHRPDVLDVELVLLPGLRHVVGQEDVGGLGDLVEHFLAVRGGGDVDADAALAAVGMFDQRVAVGGVELKAAHVDETALGVAAHRVLDLDDVGAPPVGQDRPGRRNERELRDLQYPDAVHHLDQDHSFRPAVVTTFSYPGHWGGPGNRAATHIDCYCNLYS